MVNGYHSNIDYNIKLEFILKIINKETNKEIKSKRIELGLVELIQDIIQNNKYAYILYNLISKSKENNYDYIHWQYFIKLFSEELNKDIKRKSSLNEKIREIIESTSKIATKLIPLQRLDINNLILLLDRDINSKFLFYDLFDITDYRTLDDWAYYEEEIPISSRFKRIKSEMSIMKYISEDLVNILHSIEQKYSRKSIELDQSFPNRLAKKLSKHHEIKIEPIKELYMRNNQFKEKLLEEGIISEQGKQIQEELDNLWEDESALKFLELYLSDYETKLSVYKEIYNKIKLFREILNQHYKDKIVKITKDRGIEVFSTINKGVVISNDPLSSGEKNILILYYILIFHTTDKNIVLIDAPEVSLHLIWQEDFIDTLKKIIKLSNFQVIIATHSPEIINQNDELELPIVAKDLQGKSSNRKY